MTMFIVVGLYTWFAFNSLSKKDSDNQGKPGDDYSGELLSLNRA